ncbi:tyrosine-type recombinase/integrase [Acinetobacter sp. YH16032]|uniref:tyrosine-type recombinase/integrase n=1 Tax=Acinetobacter sp. YH16032 TaxID=2601181 RepID=UPI0015D2C07E|nr:tyrosine-type recombinase/integrase [Acinetobacter sp. YH16032]
MNTHSGKADVINRSTNIVQNGTVRRKKNVEDRYKSLKPKVKEYREPTDIAGLYCRVQSNGKKSWQYRYKNSKGKWSWIGLGAYPSVSYLQAREKAEDMLNGKVEIKTQAEVKQHKLQEQSELFSNLIYEWLDRKKLVWAADTYRKEKQSVERHLIPVFGHRAYKSITPTEWLEFFTEKQINERIFNRIEKLISCCSGAYSLAKFKKGILYNPLEGIGNHLAKGESESMKHVKIHQLPKMISLIRNSSSRPIAIGLELLIHMFPRPGELQNARWEQFDFQEAIWIRPSYMMKNRIEHGIPLSRHVIQLLQELKQYSGESEYLFPGRNDLGRPISNLTFNAALNRLGYKGKQNPHGFRHIASTNLNKHFSNKSQVIEAALSHVKGGVKGAYDQGAHLEERYEIMEWWSAHIESLLT